MSRFLNLGALKIDRKIIEYFYPGGEKEIEEQLYFPIFYKVKDSDKEDCILFSSRKTRDEILKFMDKELF